MALIDLGDSPGGSQGRHWVLDPIDGTRGFVGQRQYAVCLGMLQDGHVRPKPDPDHSLFAYSTPYPNASSDRQPIGLPSSHFWTLKASAA